MLLCERNTGKEPLYTTLLGVEPEVCGATRMGHGISIVTMRSRDPVSNPGYVV